MGLFDGFKPNMPEDHIRKRERQMHERMIELEMVQQGWKAWPENATEEERGAALDAVLSGRPGEPIPLYPPGYVEEPVISEGKLEVEAEEAAPRRKLLGLF